MSQTYETFEIGAPPRLWERNPKPQLNDVSRRADLTAKLSLLQKSYDIAHNQSDHNTRLKTEEQGSSGVTLRQIRGRGSGAYARKGHGNSKRPT